MFVRRGKAGLALFVVCSIGQIVARTPESHAQTTLVAAKKAFSDSRERLTYKQARATDWFPGSRAFHQAESVPAGYALVQSVSGNVGPELSLRQTAKAGDVIVVSLGGGSGSRRIPLVYVGDEQFPDETRKRSFFIYPWHSRLEYNTFPPRRHQEGIARMRGTKPKSATAVSDRLYRWAPDQARAAQWLAGHATRRGINTRLASSLLTSASYQGFRASAGNVPPTTSPSTFEVVFEVARGGVRFAPQRANEFESTVRLLQNGKVVGTFRGSVFPAEESLREEAPQGRPGRYNLGRIRDGTYRLQLGFHNRSEEVKGKDVLLTPKQTDLTKPLEPGGRLRPTLVVDADGPVKCLRPNPQQPASDYNSKLHKHPPDTMTAIHIHNASRTRRASEGCLTLRLDDWDSFIGVFKRAYPRLSDWTSDDGYRGKQIGTLKVTTRAGAS
jgi:hypothetical protein